MTTTPSPAETTAPLPLRPVPSWRFWVPLLLQAALIVAIPAKSIYTQMSGRDVVIQTAPVDPYDLLRGYSVTLNYEISQAGTLDDLPGWKELAPGSGPPGPRMLYVVLKAPPGSPERPPKAWKPVRVTGDRPTNLAADEVAILGTYDNGLMQYGLETYYIPEDERDRINNDINQSSWGPGRQPIVVEAKVDTQGNAVLSRLWVGDRDYGYGFDNEK